MLAHLQQATTLGLLLLAAGWASWWIHAGKPVWAGIGTMVIVFGYALVLALEFLVLRRIQRDDPAPPATALQLARAWWHEVLTAPQVFCWRQPFRSRAVPDWLPARESTGRRGVLLVHGFVCNRGLWNPWMRRLREHGTPYLAINLEPVFGSIDRYAETIEAAVQRLAAATGRPPLIVAHSMGGLAVRTWLVRYAADGRIDRIITVATPHAGTWLARFSFSLNGSEMRRDGRWLNVLRRQESPRRYARFTCFYSHCDNIVFPASTATLPGADNRHVPGSAHVDLLFQPEVFNEVLRVLEAEPAASVA